MPRRSDNPMIAMADSFRELRSDYAAMKPSRFRRTRTGLYQGPGDDHISDPVKFNRMREYARDMDRNDAIVGVLVDRAVENILQTGFRFEPKTSDKGLNAELLASWVERALDPQACSVSGEETWYDIEYFSLRSTFVDGDVFNVLTDEGIQLLEAHRCQTPGYIRGARKDGIVNGVELDKHRRRKRYWFTKDDKPGNRLRLREDEFTPVDAFDEPGNPQVLQVHLNRRATITRGITIVAPIFDKLGMLEDVEFAKLVQQQIVSAFALFLERDAGFKGVPQDPRIGSRESGMWPDGNTHTTETITPGMFMKGHPGERLTGVSANIPNPEFFPHVRHLVQTMSLNFGLPLVIALMDGSETNFSGWRGAFETAKIGFRIRQRRLAARLHRPTWAWHVRGFFAGTDGEARKLPAIVRMMETGELYSVRVHFPAWPYIEPLTDSEAKALRRSTLQSSPRRIAEEEGADWDDLVRETVEDMGNLIDLAAKKAKELSEKYDIEVHWRDVAHLSPPDGARVSLGPPNPGMASPTASTPRRAALLAAAQANQNGSAHA